jgi:hypothetical protein
VWDVLAIAPTDDPKAIRRAYAARLKQIDPDRERETFARLRHALEWALAYARQPPRQPRHEPVRDAVPVDDARPVAVEVAQALQGRYDVHVFPAKSPDALRKPPPPPPPADAQERENDRALLIGLESALQRGDARAAWQLYVRAAATGALPLGGTDRMLARLFTVALDDPKFDGAAFRELTKSVGWDRPDLASAAVADVRQRVDVRLAAEDWYDRLVAIAERRLAGAQRYQARAALLLLGRIRGRGLIGITRPSLRALLDQLRLHHMWLRDRIPAEWVATLEQRYRRREIIAGSLGAVFVGWLLLQAIFVLITASASGELKPGGGVIVAGFVLCLAWGFWRVIKSLIGRWGNRPM